MSELKLFGELVVENFKHQQTQIDNLMLMLKKQNKLIVNLKDKNNILSQQITVLNFKINENK